MNISNFFISSSSQIPSGFHSLGRTELSAEATTMSLSSLPARKNLMVVYYSTSAGNESYLNFNGDGGNNYTNSDDADVDHVTLDDAGAAVKYGLLFMSNDLDKAKQILRMFVINGSPIYQASRWTNTTAQVTSMVASTSGGANFGIGSYLEVFGAD